MLLDERHKIMIAVQYFPECYSLTGEDRADILHQSVVISDVCTDFIPLFFRETFKLRGCLHMKNVIHIVVQHAVIQVVFIYMLRHILQ